MAQLTRLGNEQVMRVLDEVGGEREEGVNRYPLILKKPCTPHPLLRLQVGGNDLNNVRNMSAFIMGLCRRYTSRLGLM